MIMLFLILSGSLQEPTALELLITSIERNIAEKSENDWFTGDHGDISDNPVQRGEHAENAARAMNAYADDMRKLDGLTEEEAYRISPKLEPSKIYAVSPDCGPDQVANGNGTVRVWEEYADMELIYRGGSSSHWTLHALPGVAPALPENWPDLRSARLDRGE